MLLLGRHTNGNILDINNTVLTIEFPKLVDWLREAFRGDTALTRRTGWKLRWDIRRFEFIITEQDGTSSVQRIREISANVHMIDAKGADLKGVLSKLQV